MKKTFIRINGEVHDFFMQKKMRKMRFSFSFRKRVRCLERCHYDRVYEMGEEREVVCHCYNNSEEEARRSIIEHENSCGWQVLELELLSKDEQTTY